MEITETKKVWVAWSNTDCTEGRGHNYPYVVAESYETAKRLGKGGSVQGSDCDVTEELAIRIDGGYKWHCPTYIRPESLGDKAERELREGREEVMEKAKAAGLTEEDLKKLTGKV